MRLPALLFLVALVLTAAPKPETTTLIYLVPGPASIASLKEHADRISIIAPQVFSIDAEGFVRGEVPAEIIDIAAAKHIAVMPLVVNRGFDQPLIQTVLDSPDARARVIRYLAYYALRDGYLGFQFDFENIHYTYRDKFSLFFEEAAREFHRHQLQLSAAIVGRKDDVRRGANPVGYDNWSGVYDYKSMAAHADFISVMAYAEHGATADPGPVAGLPWVKAIADYSAGTIGARKVSLGVPFYAMRWDAQPEGSGRKWKGRSSRFSEVATILPTAAPLWDDARSSPHLQFDIEGRRTELWYEDARSLQAKMKLAHEMQFIGISAWALGQEDPAFWDTLDAWQIRHPRHPVLIGSLNERSKRAAAQLSQSKVPQRPAGAKARD
jgi:spore germination protein YaaH